MEEAYIFLKNRSPKLCVLSTISSQNTPHSAVMGYAVKENLEIVLSTHTTSRKWTDIKNSPSVSLVFGWGFTEMNIQYEGKAKLIQNGEEFTTIESFFFEQNPDAAKFKSTDTGFIIITPTWVRTADLSIHPPKINEKTF